MQWKKTGPHFTTDGGHFGENIAGTEYVTEVEDVPHSSSSKGDRVVSKKYSFTGHIAGSQIALQFSEGYLQFGNWSRSSFDVDFPLPTGGLWGTSFKPAAAVKYNFIANHLRSRTSKS